MNSSLGGVLLISLGIFLAWLVNTGRAQNAWKVLSNPPTTAAASSQVQAPANPAVPIVPSLPNYIGPGVT